MNPLHPLTRLIVFATAATFLSAGCSSGEDAFGSYEPSLVIDQPMEAPEWALLQRELLSANAEGARVFADEFLDERGYLTHSPRWGGNDGPDDAMENFWNWTLAYALGSSESIIEDYVAAWEGHLLQYAEARVPGIPMAEGGMYHREFITSFDWEHTGEALAAFHFYGLCRPHDAKYKDRVVRFANFYTGDDPEAQNYDPEHKIIRSLHSGSLGAKMTPATEQDWGGLPVDGEPERLTRYSTASNIVGDHPLNLVATTLGINAYILTGEEKYREWVLEYADAWRERILANGGNIPTNIGLDGTIGGEWDGKWYGGVFGWNFDPSTSGRNYYMRGVRIGMGNALVLTGDTAWAEPLRRQIANLYAAKRTTDDGGILLPNKHGKDGWYGYIDDQHFDVQQDIYLWSLNDADKEHIRDLPWIAYLDGRNPDYPIAALKNDLERVRQRVQEIKADQGKPEERWLQWRSDTFWRFNPVATTALINLTLGANNPGTSGNSLHSQVRYFDPQIQRAGLPPDIAALVSEITPAGIRLTLVNTSPTTAREVLIQAGAYREHKFTTVRIDGRVEELDSPMLAVRLEPSAGAELEIGMRRYVNQPALPLELAGSSEHETPDQLQ